MTRLIYSLLSEESNVIFTPEMQLLMQLLINVIAENLNVMCYTSA